MAKNEFENDDAFDECDELTTDEFLEGDGNFIKNPAVGESVEFNLKSVTKQKSKTVKNPKTGNNMDIGLSKVDYYYDFVSDEDKTFSCSSWQILGKVKAIVKKLGKFDVKLKLSHVADGRTVSKDEPAWEVYAEIDGEYKQLDRETREWV